ncbi:MAG: GNAT family N-acetyltransferase [Clostridiales bacterium]|nr:GNAT family N-acetyltransferase [Candidatus Apopatousia equi]
MKEIFNDKLNKIVKYDLEDFVLDESKSIVKDCVRVSASYEVGNADYSTNKAETYLSKLFEEHFETEEDALVYVLYDNEKPLGYVIYSMNPENSCVVEEIMVNKDYCGCGFGTLLMFETMMDLKKEGKTEVHAIVNERNYKSLYLQERVEKFIGIKSYVDDFEDKKCFEYDTTNLKSMEKEEECEC